MRKKRSRSTGEKLSREIGGSEEIVGAVYDRAFFLESKGIRAVIEAVNELENIGRRLFPSFEAERSELGAGFVSSM